MYFEKINSPDDLKSLDYKELEMYAQEVRQFLIDKVTETGGHLASNLGVVELSLALHRVYNSPTDKIIWDVGHQSYIHKIVTGRKDRFDTLRQLGGLAGFPDRDESIHDIFTTGHAGTSISSAMGLALARDLRKEKNHVLAVIGDGSIGSGMAFEAMNHAGHSSTSMTIIYNDNGMSISPTVGTFFHFVNRIRFDRRYEGIKARIKKSIYKKPKGPELLRFASRVRSFFYNSFKPQMVWDGLGFNYIGPVDGHDIRELEAALQRVRDYESGPTVVHVITRKGKGYKPAESDATSYHGVSPSSSKNHSVPSLQSYSSVFARALLEIMEEDDKVVAITAAMMDGTGLAPVVERFPSRVFDVGICEQHAVTMAGGLAAQGFKPVVAIYSTFLQRAYDQIVHDICLQRLPVVFAIDRAGIVGNDGKTHQGLLDISFLRSISGMAVSSASDGKSLRDLLFTAVYSEKPMSIRYPRGMTIDPGIHDVMKPLPLGKGVVHTKGKDCAILATGAMVKTAMEASEQLNEMGIQSTVAEFPFITPMDSMLLYELSQMTNLFFTLEEHVESGGFGSAVAEEFSRMNLSHNRIHIMGAPSVFLEHGNQSEIRKTAGLDLQAVTDKITAVLESEEAAQKVAAGVQV